ncbi:MAG TPA: DUF2142 domain-containing protein [Actinocrinis sp.]|nr:DUF2142 domain-containing protein [Actinocrinis sp.]
MTFPRPVLTPRWHPARTPTRIFLAALAVYVALSAAWSVCTPPGASPDEPSHLIKAAATARGEITGTPGFLTQSLRQGPTEQPVRYYEVPDAYKQLNLCWGDPNRDCRKPVRHSDATVLAPTTAGHYNPIYYAAVGWPSLIFRGEDGMYLIRLTSALLNSLLLAAACTIAARLRRPAFALAGLAAATTPMVLFLNGVVNPNGIEVSSAVLAWTAALAMTVQPDRDQFRGRMLALGIGLAVLANARPLGFEWTAAILAGSAVVARRGALTAIVRDRFTWLVGGCAAGPMLFGLWWTLAHSDNAKVPYVTDNAFVPAARSALELTQYYIDDMIGVFGWLDTYSPAVTYLLWSGILIMLMVLACTLGRRRESAAVLGLLLGVVFIPVLAQGMQAKNIGLVWQGRYLLAFAVGLPLLCGATAAAHASAVSHRMQQRILVLLLPALAFADYAAFFHALRRYMVGLNGRLLLHPISWEPPGTWMLWLPFYAIALAGLVILVTRLGAAAAAGAQDDPAPQDDLPGLAADALATGLDLSGHARVVNQGADFAIGRQAPVS